MNNSGTDRMVMKQLIFLLIAVLALLLIFGLLIARSANAGEALVSQDTNIQERDDRDRALRQAAEQRYLKHRDEARIRREYGNYAIATGVTLENDLVVTRGTVTIAGKVNGSVLVIRGDALIDSTGEVIGDVVSIGGRIDRRPNSRVFGDMVETSPRYLIEEKEEAPRARYDEGEEKEHRWNHNRQWRRWQEEWNDNFDFKAHYNRVDGLFLGGALPRTYNRRYLANVEVFGSGGYGFKAKRWQYEAGAEFYVGRDFRFILGGEAHDLTDSQDEWLIPEVENSLAAALINEDFRDYYRRDGFSFYATQYLGRPFKLTAAYRHDDLFALRNKTDWSLFVNKKRFRSNPAIDEGRMVSYRGNIVLDTRDHDEHPHRGWLVSLEGETSRPELDSQFDFDRFIVDIRRYQPIGYGKNFDIRLRAGTGRGFLPQQYLFDLGGLSTLRGYRFKEFTGDRMVLANVEYRLNSKTSRLHDIPIIEEFNLILFADAGLAWFAEDNTAADKSFDTLTWDKLKTNAGLALTDRDGQVRLDFAKRTDVGGKDVVVTLRLNRDF